MTGRRLACFVLAGCALYALTLTGLHFVAGGWKPHRVETAWIVFGFLLSAILIDNVVRGGDAAPATRHRRPGRPGAIVAVCIVGAALLVYAPALGIGFLSDDFVLLELPSTAVGWGTFFRPLPLRVLWLADRLDPAVAPVVVHALSLALHLINGGLVWSIARRIGAATTAGTLGAALFLVFPASVEAVVWGAAIQDLIAATGSLAFIWLALGRAPLVPMLLAFAVAILSKESSVTAPFVAAALRLARDGKFPRAAAVPLLAAGATALAFAGWRLIVAEAHLPSEPSRYVLKTVMSMTFATLSVPLWSKELRGFPLAGVVLAAIPPAVAVAAMWQTQTRRTARVWLALIVWVAATVLPAYAWFFIGPALEGGRHLYVASAAWFVLLGMAADVARPRARLALTTLLTATVMAYVVAARSHVTAWERAAAERERILDAAHAVSAGPCRSVRLENATDSVDGAYVFRNGLTEALRRRGLVPGSPAPEVRCRFRWNGERFVPAAHAAAAPEDTPGNR